jgi:cytochrome c-type biogenesis protein CcmH/NrfG
VHLALGLVAYGQGDASAAHSLMASWCVHGHSIALARAICAPQSRQWIIQATSGSSCPSRMALATCAARSNVAETHSVLTSRLDSLPRSLQLQPTHARCLFALTTLGLVQNNPVLAASALQEAARLDPRARLEPKNMEDYVLLKGCLHITMVCLLRGRGRGRGRGHRRHVT